VHIALDFHPSSNDHEGGRTIELVFMFVGYNKSSVQTTGKHCGLFGSSHSLQGCEQNKYDSL